MLVATDATNYWFHQRILPRVSLHRQSIVCAPPHLLDAIESNACVTERSYLTCEIRKQIDIVPFEEFQVHHRFGRVVFAVGNPAR